MAGICGIDGILKDIRDFSWASVVEIDLIFLIY